MKRILLAAGEFSPKLREDIIKIAKLSLKDVSFAKILALTLKKN